MKILLSAAITLILFHNLFSQTDTSGYVGKIIPGESITWIDDSTGYEITQWTTKSSSYHPYFTTESFIDDEAAIIYSYRTGSKQLYKLSLETGEMIQMTTASNLRRIEHLPQYKSVWYFDENKLFELNTSSLISKEVYDFNDFAYHIGSFSVTCDAKWFVFSVNKKEQTPDSMGYGPYAIYKLNLKDKSIEQITMDYGFNIGHIQANPVDPNLIMFCWQWEKFGRPLLVGHAPIRIWWINIDGNRRWTIKTTLWNTTDSRNLDSGWKVYSICFKIQNRSTARQTLFRLAVYRWTDG